MDLQISVFLLFVCFTAGHVHFCYECEGLMDSCEEKPVLCPIGSSECLSTTRVIEIGDISTETKEKKCSFGCRNGSLNFGDVKSSSFCCGTYFCNTQDAPDPSSLVLNGKKCYACYGGSCSNIVSCSGSEDRCITATVTLEGHSSVVKGCVSKLVCDVPGSTFVKDISSCSWNLCNGAESVTQSSSSTQSAKGSQSFLFLCCSLLSFILLH